MGVLVSLILLGGGLINIIFLGVFDIILIFLGVSRVFFALLCFFGVEREETGDILQEKTSPEGSF